MPITLIIDNTKRRVGENQQQLETRLAAMHRGRVMGDWVTRVMNDAMNREKQAPENLS